jgi:hypothetical protein
MDIVELPATMLAAQSSSQRVRPTGFLTTGCRKERHTTQLNTPRISSATVGSRSGSASSLPSFTGGDVPGGECSVSWGRAATGPGVWFNPWTGVGLAVSPQIRRNSPELLLAARSPDTANTRPRAAFLGAFPVLLRGASADHRQHSIRGSWLTPPVSHDSRQEIPATRR